MNHTPEPWYVDNTEFPSVGGIIDSTGEAVAQTFERIDAIKNQNEKRNINARRIVACVNVCAGIPTETLEKVDKVAFVNCLFDGGLLDD